jgi:excisionase family DNA binding protein
MPKGLKKARPRATPEEVERLRGLPFLSVGEVAKIFDCSNWTVRNWEYEGKLKAIRLAGLVRFERSAIEDFINAARAQ